MVLILLRQEVIYLFKSIDNSVVVDELELAIKHDLEPRHEISNYVVCATSKGSDQPSHTCSLIRAFASRLNIL